MITRASRFFLALVASAAVAGAQGAPSSPPAAASPEASTTPAAGAEQRDARGVVLTDKPVAPVPSTTTVTDGGNRSVSPTIAEALALGMPKFNPPTPTPVVNEPQELRETDKPKNEIPRLPKYMVHDTRPVVFKDRDMYTREQFVSLSYKLHPGLKIGDFLGLNEGPAYQMHLDEQRLADIADLTDTAHAMERGGDKGESQYILKETQDSYLRPVPDFSWSGPGGGAQAEPVK